MTKKKNQQKKGGIDKYYDENKPDVVKQTNFGGYSVKKTKKGYELDIHRERGIDEKLVFKDQQTLDEYLKTLHY